MVTAPQTTAPLLPFRIRHNSMSFIGRISWKPAACEARWTFSPFLSTRTDFGAFLRFQQCVVGEGVLPGEGEGDRVLEDGTSNSQQVPISRGAWFCQRRFRTLGPCLGNSLILVPRATRVPYHCSEKVPMNHSYEARSPTKSRIPILGV